MSSLNLLRSKVLILTVLFLMPATCLLGQEKPHFLDTIWHSIPDSGPYYMVNDMAQSSNGLIAFTGICQPNGKKEEMVFHLINLEGKTIVKHNYGEAGKEGALAIKEIPGQGFLLAGYTDSKKIRYQMKDRNNLGGKDAWLLKLDAAGNQLWNTLAGSSGDDHFNDVIQLANGNILAAGAIGQKAYLVQYSQEGEMLWEKAWPQGLKELRQIYFDENGELGILAYDKDNRSVFLKTDTSGRMASPPHVLENDTLQQVSFLHYDPEHKRYVLCGTAYSRTHRRQIALLHLDLEGKNLGVHLYGGKGEEMATTMTQTRDGRYVIAALSNSYQRLARRPQGFVLFIDAVTWEEELTGNYYFGGNQFDRPQVLLQLSDGSILVAGSSDNGKKSNSEAWILRLSGQSDQYNKPPLNLISVLHPSEVNVIWDAPEFNEKKDTLELVDLNSIQLNIKITANHPLDSTTQFNLFINDTLARSGRDFVYLNYKENGLGHNSYNYQFEIRLKLSEEVNHLTYWVKDKNGNGLKQPIPTSFITRYHPNKKILHLISIGIPRELQFSARDAQAFAEAMEKQKGKLYKDVIVHLLNTPKVTEAGELRDTITEIFVDYKKINSRQKAEDALSDRHEIMLYISSHAYLDGGFRIPCSNYGALRPRNYIDFRGDILSYWNQFQGVKYLFLDACQSGSAIAVPEKTGSTYLPPGQSLEWETEIDPKNNFVFLSCHPDEFSYEHPDWGHGAFTKALLEAFENKKVRVGNENIQADDNGNGVITVQELFYFLHDRVPKILRTVNDEIDRKQMPYMPAGQLKNAAYRPIYVLPR